MEQITVIGNIGRDATLKDHSGKQFVSFSIAANKKWKDAQGNTKERTTWYNCTTRQLNLAQYLKQGVKVLAQGEPNSRLYQDQHGSTQLSNDIMCDKVQLLSSANNQAPQQQHPSQSTPAKAADSDEDLPF